MTLTLLFHGPTSCTTKELNTFQDSEDLDKEISEIKLVHINLFKSRKIRTTWLHPKEKHCTMLNRPNLFLIVLTALTVLGIISYQILLNFNSAPTESSPSTKLPLPSPRNFSGNWPDIYFSNSKKPSKFNNTCARFPQIFDIKIKNNLWQTQKTTNGVFYLFGAHIDHRYTLPMVRILGTYNRLKPEGKFFCQFWYEDSPQPVIVQSEKLLWLFRPHWGADKDTFDHPYLVSCPLHDQKAPKSVSLVGKACDNPSNNLKIVSKAVEDQKNFVVCVKGLSFPFEDNSVRLVEWIELLFLLGAEKINFYEFSVHPNMKLVLEYYSNSGQVEVAPMTLVGDVSNLPLLQSKYLKEKIIERRLQEVIPYNDCLYRNLQEFKFVVLLDTDEVIVPAENSWVELIETLENLKPNRSSYVARNVYFLDSHLHRHEWFENIPRNLHMLQHVYRAKDHTKRRFFVKGFHDTRRVLALHNHFPLACVKPCSDEEISVELAQLQHYRTDCVREVSNCDQMRNDSVLDTRVWNFKDELIERVGKVLKDLKLSNDF